MDAHEDEPASYDTSEGTIRFTADKALPAALVTKLVEARDRRERPTPDGKGAK